MKRKSDGISNEEPESTTEKDGDEPDSKKRKIQPESEQPIEILNEKSEDGENILVAVVGCAHGDLDDIYQHIQNHETTNAVQIGLLIICGDFQASRNLNELQSMNCPMKYKHMRDFHKYYNGLKEAPVMTIFVGGNHEAITHNISLYYGGWVCKNMYYLGNSGSVIYRGLRVCGYSGIFKKYDYNRGYYEKIPLSESNKRSIYHTREFEIKKLSLLINHDIDIMISHDWPRGIWKADQKRLFKVFRKDHARDMLKNQLGSLGGQYLLKVLKPKHWFSGHLHFNYRTRYEHDPEKNSDVRKITQFAASSKPMPQYKKHRYLQVVSVKLPENHGLYHPEKVFYDPKWLSVCKASHGKIPLEYFPAKIEKAELVKGVEECDKFVSTEVFPGLEIEKMEIVFDGVYRKIENVYDSSKNGDNERGYYQPRDVSNVQRDLFLKMLDLKEDFVVKMLHPERKKKDYSDTKKADGETKPVEPVEKKKKEEDVDIDAVEPIVVEENEKIVVEKIPKFEIEKKPVKKKKKKKVKKKKIDFQFDWEDDEDEFGGSSRYDYV